MKARTIYKQCKWCSSKDRASHAWPGLVKFARLAVATLILTAQMPARSATIDDAADLHTQQAQEKIELEEMKQELDGVKRNMQEAVQGMQQVGKALEQRQKLKEFNLECKEHVWELAPGVFANAITYNGTMPGPVIRVQEGEQLKITVTNKTRTATSLYIHGMHLPHQVNGLPRRGQGIIEPGQSFSYQFVASHPGTYWYHPQVMHGEQQYRGLYGAIVVEPRSMPKTYERDIVLALGQWIPTPQVTAVNLNPAARTAATKTGTQIKTIAPAVSNERLEAPVYLANGKSAPAIPPLEVKRGERIRIRIINASGEACPLMLTGHRFEVMAQNGSESIEPHVNRDTITVNPGERYDVEFTADNPGVWSLCSMLPHQVNLNGKFPGGLAIVVRYPEAFK